MAWEWHGFSRAAQSRQKKRGLPILLKNSRTLALPWKSALQGRASRFDP